MPLRERAVLAGLIWLAVYPSVLGMNYVLDTAGLGDLPLPLSVFATTIFTVPLLEFVLIPRIKRWLGEAEARMDVDGELREEAE